MQVVQLFLAVLKKKTTKTLEKTNRKKKLPVYSMSCCTIQITMEVCSGVLNAAFMCMQPFELKPPK